MTEKTRDGGRQDWVCGRVGLEDWSSQKDVSEVRLKGQGGHCEEELGIPIGILLWEARYVTQWEIQKAHG